MQPDVLLSSYDIVPLLTEIRQRVMISHDSSGISLVLRTTLNMAVISLLLGPKKAAVGRWANQYHGSYATHDRTIFDFY